MTATLTAERALVIPTLPPDPGSNAHWLATYPLCQVHDEPPELPPDDCDTCWPPVTPRVAVFIRSALELLVDEVQVAAATTPRHTLNVPADLTSTGLFGGIPEMVRARISPEWCNRYLQTAIDVLNRIDEGDPQPRTTAEEMVLHTAISDAADLTGDGVFDELDMTGLPSHPADEQFELLREILFADWDVLMLHNPAFEGFMLASDLLAPENWFTRFR